MDKMIRNTKINRITFLVTGIIFMFFGFFMPAFFMMGAVFLLAAYFTNKKYKELLNKSNELNEILTKVDKINEETDAKYIFFNFKVAGVTFKNGRKTRQAILRAFKWGDEKIEYSDFEVYEYEGKPAVYVKINDQIVGNIPANKVSEFLDLEKSHHRDNVHIDIYGGSKLDDGSRTNYGCEITVRYLREEL